MKRNSLKISIPFLIVGAGPVGMTLALHLANKNIPFFIIDKREKLSMLTRGIVVNQASLDIFDKIGVGESLQSLGMPVPEVIVYRNKKLIGKIHFRNLNIKRPYFFHVEQNRVEVVLSSKLKRLGVNIQHGCELIELKTSKNGVTASVNSSRCVQHYHANYVIACDGGQSSVRSLSNIAVDSKNYGGYFILADVCFERPPLQIETHYYLTLAGYAMVVPIPNGNHRVIFSFNDPYLPNIINVTTETINKWLYHRTGHRYGVKQIFWSTQAPFGDRLAKRAVQGRTILAGDALHQFSPIGGTNMNIGIQDAACLGALLSEAFKDLQNQQWLKIYEQKRCPIIEKQRLSTHYATRLMVRSRDIQCLQRPWHSTTLNELFEDELPRLLTGYN